MNTIPQDPKETTVVEFPVAFSGPDFGWNSEELIQLVCDFWKTTQALAEVFIEVPFFRELGARMWSKYKSSHGVTSEFIEEHRQEFQALVFLLWFFSEVRARADRLSVEADQNFLELMRRLFLNTLLRRGGFDDTVRGLKHLQREGGIFRMTYSQSQLLMDVVKGAVGMDACDRSSEESGEEVTHMVRTCELCGLDQNDGDQICSNCGGVNFHEREVQGRTICSHRPVISPSRQIFG